MKKIVVLLLLFSGLLSIDSFAQCGSVNTAFTPSQTNICGPGAQVISFTNNSTGANNGTATYEWFLNGTSFDNTNGLAAPNNSNISAVGTYTFMLVATDASVPCTDTAIVVVNIYPIPTSDFAFFPDNQCAGTTNINFANNSTGVQGGTTYLWNFGDGNTSTSPNIMHTYGAGGAYNVTLTVTNGPGCTDISNTTVTALDIPNIGISGADADGDLTNCLLPADPSTSQDVTFSNTTTGAVSYDWDFGDGSPIFTTASNADFVHTYNTYGTFTVTMTATHANGCTFSQTLTVVFEKYVSSSMTLDITEYSGCAPHNLTTLTNLSVNANSYIWDFGDGTVITTTSHIPPPHPYLTEGTYTIGLTAINSCNQANATISPIIIIDGPTASFIPGLPFAGGTGGCAPQNVNATNNSVDAQPANNYQWDMGNGNTYANTITPPQQTYDTTGVYTIQLVAGNACGTDTIEIDIDIDTVPVVEIVSVPLDGCSPLTVATTNNSYEDPINYQWFVDGVFQGNMANLPDQTFINTNNTIPVNHTIQLNGNNQCGNDTDSETIIVHPETQAIFAASTDTICIGESITFTSNSFGEAIMYEWDFGNGTDLTQGPHTVTYNTDGDFTVELIVDGFCGPDTMTLDIFVAPIPLADFTVDVDTSCVDFDVAITNNSDLGGTYDWTFNGGIPATSTAYAPGTIDYAAAGAYLITLDVDILGCVNSDTVTIQANPLPIPTFTLLPADGCTPLEVAFTNTSPNNPGDIFDWDFGNGNTFTGQNPANEIYIAAANDSVYTVELIITTAEGCVDSVETTVTVHPLPIADYNVLPDTACAGDAIAFLNNSIGASTYLWTFGDGGTSGLTSPSNTYNITGDITTQLIAYTAFGCTDTMEVPIYVDSIPTADFSFNIVCDIDTTDFADLSTGSPTMWEWDFGDASALDNNQNPSHFYGAPGNYTVILTVTNPAGCTSTVNQLVAVSEVPQADFLTNPTCQGSAAQFTDNTTGIPTQWEWDFDDGSPIDNNQNPTHIYGNIGTYDVELVALAGNGCSDTIILPITVTPIPTADFDFVPVCATDTTFFTDASAGTPDTYFWDFGDGNTDNTNNPNPSHVYANDGAYTVTLTAGYAASGCTHDTSFVVDAHPRTTPDFSTNTPCLGGVTTFTDNTGGAPTQWAWDFGDGSPVDNNQNPTHSYLTPGVFNVQLITENVFACPDTFLTTVEVFPLPTADFTFSTVCLNAATDFTDISTDAVAWEWDFGDASPVSNNQSPSHTYINDGTFDVQLVVTNIQGCTDTLVQQVTVNPNPTANFAATTSCHTYPTVFTDNSVGSVNYFWDFGDLSAVDNNAAPSYTYVNDGTYSVEMIVENIFGCTDTMIQLVDVLTQPQAGFINNTVCSGETVVFTDTSTLGPTTWEWDFGDGTPLDFNQNPSHIFNPGGIYNVSLVVGNIAGCTDTAVIAVDVYTVPVPDFMADTVCLFSVTTFTDLSVDAVALAAWDWDFDDGNTSFSQNPTYIFQAPGQYDVELIVTNMNGCDSSVIIPVFVSDIPVAAFTADTVCQGNVTTFTDQSTGVPTSWIWSFGDGNVSTDGPIANHTYAAPGSYVVSLVVDAGGVCTDQVFGVVEVEDNVIAGITAVDSICDGNVVDFFDNSVVTAGAIDTYFWDFGDGNTAITEDVSHLYGSVGTYTVTHVVGVAGGCSSQTTWDVTILDVPIASFLDIAACQNGVTSFADQSVIANGNIAQWTWDFGDGTPVITTQNPNHIFANPGNFNVGLTVTSEFGCSAQVSIPTIVYPAPLADFTAPTSCPDDTIQYTDLSSIISGSIVDWEWDFGDGGTDNIQNPAHQFLVLNDSFDVTLIVTSNFGCTDTVTKLIETYPFPTFQYGPEWAAGCAPYEVQFNDSTAVEGGIITGWEWTFDDGSASFLEDPIHIFNEAGDYFVSLEVTTSQGCTFNDELLYPVTVYPLPVAEFSPVYMDVSVLEAEIEFTDESIDAVNWEWSFGDGNYSNDVNPIHEYLDTGYYQTMLIVHSDFGCLDTAIHSIHVFGEFAIYTPNAFTPNGDSKNGYFRAYGMGIEKFEIWVFNRWGENIWYADDMELTWDGTYKGVTVQDDVYVWLIKAIDVNGDEYEKRGHVTVLK